MTETEFLSQYLRPLAKAGGRSSVGLWDDGAVLPPAGPHHEWALSTDTLIETVHLPSECAPEDFASRLMRCALSDMAAMAAHPVYWTLALTLPRLWDETRINALMKQLAVEQDSFGLTLLGGDTTRYSAAHALATVSVFGQVAKNASPRRHLAKPEDRLFVSGTIGDGFLGRLLIEGKLHAKREDAEHAQWLKKCFLKPEPELEKGLRLSERRNAAIDISDGLLADAAKLCEASDCVASIDTDKVPFSDAARAVLRDSKKPLELAGRCLCAGDDYRLLIATGDENAQWAQSLGFTEIGLCQRSTETEQRVKLVGKGPRPPHPSEEGFDHFLPHAHSGEEEI